MQVAVRALTIAAVAVTAFGAGCGEDSGRDAAPSGAANPVQKVALPKEVSSVGRPHVAGRVLREASGATATLGERIFAPLVGDLSPTAALSADGRSLAYSTWADAPGVDYRHLDAGDAIGIPSIWIHDLRTRSERLLALGADSFAWRSDGAIAYARANEPMYRSSSPYPGHVYVRRAPAAQPERWSTEPGRYVVVGWAGSRLIVYRRPFGEQLDVAVFDAPGQARVLARDAGVVAIEPTGERLVVESGERTEVELLDVAGGARLASLHLDPESVGPVVYGGDWAGERVVAPGNGKLVVLHVADRLVLEHVIDFGVTAFKSGGISDARFLDDSGNRVAAIASVVEPLTLEQAEAGMEEFDAPGSAFVLTCERTTRACRRGPAYSPRTWIQLLDDSAGRRRR